MRTFTAALLSVAILIVSSLLLAGCVTTTADGIQLQPGAMGGDPVAALGMDPATYVILDLERSGGIAGLAERARLYLDGHVLLERQGAEPVTFQLSPAEQAQVTAALDAADFYRNAAQSTTPVPVSPDAMQYRIHRRGVLLQGEVTTQDGSVPAWLEPLLPLLTNVLLTPDLARVQPFVPPAAVPASTPAVTQTVAAPAAPALVLLEFVRSQPGADVRVLLNLDRTYSVASAGGVREGQLARDEMAALLQLLEAADLRTRAGDYTPDEPCADCARYDVTYRNLLGGATVRGEEGALPEWLQALTAALVDAFIGTETITASAAPTATLPVLSTTVVPTATASPAVSTPAATATPTPAIAVASPTPVAAAASPTPVVTAASPTPAAPAVEPAYSALDLLADLAAQGARVEASPGRITKPYLSVPGRIVQVDGQPLQVFQYADAAALAADVAGLAPSASSIDGVPLAWPAAPHFWRKGSLLALAVSNDQALVDLISSVMGPQFAGR
jgi:hypothetical protein